MISLIVLFLLIAVVIAAFSAVTNSRKAAYHLKELRWETRLAAMPTLERNEAIHRRRRNEWLMIPVRLAIAFGVIIFVAKYWPQ